MIPASDTHTVESIVDPRPSDVQAITEEVWSTFLGDQSPLIIGIGEEFDPEWSASVAIRGAWNGVVAIELAEGLAQLATRSMLGLEPDSEVSDVDLADAVGELVNMVGGNIKGLVPGPSRLSLPLVAAGRIAHGSEQVEVARLDCSWAGAPVLVTVHLSKSNPRESR